MAELRGLSVEVPIRFSERAQRDLYETCMGYKKLAEMRGDENEKLRKLVYDMWYEGAFEPGACYVKAVDRLEERTRELGIEV